MRRLAIPGTDILADVAAEQMMSDPGAVGFGNFAAQLDRRVRNAFAAVENVRNRDGAGWTGINTTRACAAAVGNRHRVIEFAVGQNTAEKEPRTRLFVNDARILAKPADSRVLGE